MGRERERERDATGIVHRRIWIKRRGSNIIIIGQEVLLRNLLHFTSCCSARAVVLGSAALGRRFSHLRSAVTDEKTRRRAVIVGHAVAAVEE